MRRYYIHFTGGEHMEAEQVKKLLQPLVKLGDVKNMRTAKQYGWSNQPDVVTFSTIHSAYGISEFIKPQLPANTLILKKDW